MAQGPRRQPERNSCAHCTQQLVLVAVRKHELYHRVQVALLHSIRQVKPFPLGVLVIQLRLKAALGICCHLANEHSIMLLSMLAPPTERMHLYTDHHERAAI